MVEPGGIQERLVPLNVQHDRIGVEVLPEKRGRLGHAVESGWVIRARHHGRSTGGGHRVGDALTIRRDPDPAQGGRAAGALEHADDERSSAEIL
jgi:hypothetical protein